ncbi:MAG TPA: GNAT family N-acetyltransferase [Planctomycetaceae bacterium]|nr:GNAT family N-acetyltransferase [Planctomycetaceae bacterium]
MTVAEVVYSLEPNLSVEDFRAVLVASTLGERRPIEDAARLQQMLTAADVIVTARVDGRIVGVSRALTDFSFATYLSDLAVDRDAQGRGIGRELIQRTHQAAGLHTMLVLVAAPGARTYYPHIGLEPHDSCWTIPRNA